MRDDRVLRNDHLVPGTPGPDELSGTPGDDTIRARGGDDTVHAGLGTDQVWLGRGDDTLDVALTHLLEPDAGSLNYHVVERGIGTTLVHDFDPGHDRIAATLAYQGSPSGPIVLIPDPGHALDTDHDGVLDPGDRYVHQGEGGLVLDFGRLFDDRFHTSGHAGQEVVLLGLSAIPDDAIA